MSFKDLKITSYQDSVSALPDYPSDAGYSAAQLKAVFDGRTDKEIKQKFNALIDEIVTKFEGLDANIADAVEDHNQNEDAHEKIITPIQTRIAEIIGALITMDEDIAVHIGNKENPHEVTPEQIGLGSVNNTPDSEKSVAYALNAELDLLGNVIHEHYATKEEVGDVDLSGYVKWEDFEARTTPIENNVADIIEDLDEIEAVAKGRATGYVFDTLADLDAWLSDSANTANLVLGDNLYIRATNVPDYWWDGESKQELETQKVDLSEYVKNTDYATENTAGVIKITYSFGVFINDNGQLYLAQASNTQIDKRSSPYQPITPNNLEYAVKSVGDSYYATEEQVGNIETALDSILAIQNEIIGG